VPGSNRICHPLCITGVQQLQQCRAFGGAAAWRRRRRQQHGVVVCGSSSCYIILCPKYETSYEMAPQSISLPEFAHD